MPSLSAYFYACVSKEFIPIASLQRPLPSSTLHTSAVSGTDSHRRLLRTASFLAFAAVTLLVAAGIEGATRHQYWPVLRAISGWLFFVIIWRQYAAMNRQRNPSANLHKRR